MERFRVRDVQVKVRCTEIENLQLEKLASENNMSKEAYIRKMALEGYIVNVDFTELKQLIYEINKIGNNINQIAHRVNRDNTFYAADMEHLEKQVASIWTLLRAELLSFK